MIKKLLSQLGNKHFLSLAGNVIMSVLGMVTIGILSRSFAAEKDLLGSWFFFQGTLLLIDTFRSGFLTTAFIKFYAGAQKERADAVLGSTWFIATCITLALSLLNIPAYFLVDSVNDQGVKLLFQWAGVCFWAMLPFFIATCVAQGEQRFDRLLYLRMMNQGVFILSVIAFILFKKLTLQAVLYSYLLSYLLPSIVVLFNGWAQAGMFKKRNAESTKDLFNFGKFSVGTTLSANMFRASDNFIINFMLGPAALAIYNIGGRLMELVEIPLRSFAATGMPELSAAYNANDKNSVIDTMKKYTGMLTILLIPAGIVAVILADIGIGIIAGKEYVATEAPNVFRLFMTFALLYPADRFMALTVDVIHQPQINFIKVLIMLAANIMFDFLGIFLFKNIYGVALASVIPTIIGVAVGYWALNRYHPFSFKSVFTVGYTTIVDLAKDGLKKTKRSVD